MKKLCVLFALTVLLLASVGAYALDLNPPPWRGEAGSTWAQWEFNYPDLVPAPDFGVNPYGPPELFVYPAHPWQPVWGNMEGVWPLSGAIEVQIPNNPVENEYKLLQIQLTWAAQVPVPTHPVIAVEAELLGAPVPSEDITLLSIDDVILGPTGETNAGDLWHQTTLLYEIVPNPVLESIYISGSIMVDELVIDTICVPEPATGGLLTLGAVALLRRRKHA